ncbi:MAG: type II toxin-antitoxin system prevent-host-death family antitoxin [Psychrilyobacter sp.]|nr:type II toxin-antitoxin system prevent-host-death family antitoxin [Psychrilyobacter sp.]
MKAVNYTEFRQNLKTNLDSVYNDHEALIVTRKRNENMVVISQEDYNSLTETVYLLSSLKNSSRLIKSREQVKSGKLINLNLDLLED